MSRIRDRSRSAWQYLVRNPLRVLEALLLVSCFGVAIWSEFASDKPDWAFWCFMGLGLVWYVLWLRRWLPGQDFTKQSWSDRFEEGKTAASNDRPAASWFEYEQPRLRALLVPLRLPPRLLVCGAGPDARPVVELAAFLAWRVTVVDHRSAYADAARFAPGTEVLETRPESLTADLQLDRYDAAVVMSHHLDSDLAYLRALAPTRVPYVGLLGPAARRERLLRDLGPSATPLQRRLRAPIGLDIGGRAAESIALAIVSEIHAVLAGRAGRPFQDTAGTR